VVDPPASGLRPSAIPLERGMLESSGTVAACPMIPESPLRGGRTARHSSVQGHTSRDGPVAVAQGSYALPNWPLSAVSRQPEQNPEHWVYRAESGERRTEDVPDCPDSDSWERGMDSTSLYWYELRLTRGVGLHPFPFAAPREGRTDHSRPQIARRFGRSSQLLAENGRRKAVSGKRLVRTPDCTMGRASST
jgi:hypothetical protein